MSEFDLPGGDDHHICIVSVPETRYVYQQQATTSINYWESVAGKEMTQSPWREKTQNDNREKTPDLYREKTPPDLYTEKTPDPSRRMMICVVSRTNVCPVSGLTLDEAAAFLAGVRARRAADRR